MFCIHCGAPNPEDATFCGSCGKTIGAPANSPVPTEALQQVHSSAEQPSWNATGQPPAQISSPPQPPPQYQPAAPRGKPVLWILAGFAACLLIVIAVALGFRQSQPSTAPETTRTNSPSDSLPAAAPVAETPRDPAPVADTTPAPVSTPVQASAPAAAPVQAPPPPPPAAPQNSIVGDWKATTLVGSSIGLHLGADGRYILNPGSDKGVYVFSSGDGTLRLQSNSFFSKGIMIWSCQLAGDSLSCVDPNGGGHVYSRVQ